LDDFGDLAEIALKLQRLGHRFLGDQKRREQVKGRGGQEKGEGEGDDFQLGRFGGEDREKWPIGNRRVTSGPETFAPGCPPSGFY
jgi:hypothetical protein